MAFVMTIVIISVLSIEVRTVLSHTDVSVLKLVFVIHPLPSDVKVDNILAGGLYIRRGIQICGKSVVRGGRSNYFYGLGSIDYFYESNRYFLPVTLDPSASPSPSILRHESVCCMHSP